MKKNQLLKELIEITLKISSQAEVNKHLEMAKMLCNSQIVTSKPHSIKTWSKKWVSELKDSKVNDLIRISKSTTKEKLQIYKILDILKFSSKKFVVTKENPSMESSSIVPKNYLSDKELVRELIVMLQGGESGVFSFINSEISSDNLLMPHQKSSVLKIARNALCLTTIQETINTMDGIIGQSLSSVLQKEKGDYIKAMLSANNDISLLGLTVKFKQ